MTVKLDLGIASYAVSSVTTKRKASPIVTESSTGMERSSALILFGNRSTDEDGKHAARRVEQVHLETPTRGDRQGAGRDDEDRAEHRGSVSAASDVSTTTRVPASPPISMLCGSLTLSWGLAWILAMRSAAPRRRRWRTGRR